MQQSKQSDWRGWIWIAVSVSISLLAGGFGLYENANAYTDMRVGEVRQDVCRQIDAMRQEISIVHEDIKQLLRRQVD